MMKSREIDFAHFFLRRLRNGELAELDMCRVAAYWLQDGKCYITGVQLGQGERELHHRMPRHYQGSDVPGNLFLLHKTVHAMVHAETFEKFYTLLHNMPLTEQQLRLVSMLRYEADMADVPDQGA